MPSAHATRNASGAKRWMNCPGSIRMEHGRPNNSSDAARLGTAAHALGEACLLDGSDAGDWLGGHVRLDPTEQATVYRPAAALDPGSGDKTILVPVHATADGLPPEGHEDFPVDADMADAVQVYLDAVREEMERLGQHAELQVEKRFDLSWLVGYDYDEEAEARALSAGEFYVSPSGIRRDDFGDLVHADGRPCHGPMFGTNDASVVLLFDHATVFDYKHGQGVAVEVEDNEQELYYALGAAKELDWAFETLDLVIVQPRCRHADGKVRRWSTNKAYLREFEERLRLAAHATEDVEAPLAAGAHCKFCKAAAVCPELREDAFRQAGVDFGEPGDEPSALRSVPEDSDEDLELRMRAIPLLDLFIKSTEAEALRRLRETPGGVTCFGKLVRKKSNRAFVTGLTRPDPQTGEEVAVSALELLEEAGIPRSELYEAPKPKTPSKVEAVRPPSLMARLKADGVRAPARWIKELVAQYTHKPEGGITVAPLDDPRDPVDPSAAAAADFEEFDGEAEA
ncbi:hypothetical protein DONNERLITTCHEN_00510 [Janthinobacterium phage vB_JliS-Donnerlittchen]|uniref:DUF2800 domain-containing protein n=1 Tax=Janthinobacterium phage vB_JliS-Donnerlittchen TaxID=2948610 RepID=A0A9E7MRE3_9CAUD|nr:hypothetical protein P9A49_gp52 [Janthinobacterium phage vB_JliM-Donnerlittchen]USN14452.1 hypothetical protein DONNERLITTCHEN_00510 [Janthinobacterium phage vB_JliM-Donnerlittchen]